MSTDLPAILTVEDAQRLSAEDVMIDFTVHPVLLPAVVAFVNRLGLDLREARRRGLMAGAAKPMVTDDGQGVGA